MTHLKKWIRDNYGNQKTLARELDVAEQTIVRWIKKEPQFLMRHAFTLSESQPAKKRTKFVCDLAVAIIEHMETVDHDS